MLRIIVPSPEMFDYDKDEFVPGGEDYVLDLEHSLAALSKWESVHEKPFLSHAEKTPQEMLDYIIAMAIDPFTPPEVFQRLTEANVAAINEYINAVMTGTTFSDLPGRNHTGETISSELIYYWMFAFQIDKECERWHLNRLFTLIRVANLKNNPPKKMSKQDWAAKQRALNAERRRQTGSSG